MRVHPAEEIPGEEGQIDLFYPIGPSANELADGQIALVTRVLQQQGRIPFSAGPGQDREPRPLLITHSHDNSSIEATALGAPEIPGPGFGKYLAPLGHTVSTHATFTFEGVAWLSRKSSLCQTSSQSGLNLKLRKGQFPRHRRNRISAVLQYLRAVGCEQFTQDPLCSWTQVLT